MFAVSRKPINTITGKFLIKNDIRDPKPKGEESLVKPHTQNGETHVRKIFENLNSSKNSPPPSEKVSLTAVTATAPPKEEMKRIKIRLSIIRDVPYSQKNNLLNAATDTNQEKKSLKKTKEMKIKNKRMNREGNFNCGRWQPDEHERFIEAIMKFGNEWKSVQKHVGTRSSTQARSHAQKFFVKIKKANLVDFNLDLSKNSIKTLHEIANTMNADEYFQAIKQLNCVAFERKNNNKRRHRKEGSSLDSSVFLGEVPNPLSLNNEDIFSLNTNENSLFNQTKSHETSFNINTFNSTKNINCTNFSNNNLSNLLNSNKNNPGNYQIKIIQNDNKEKKTNNKSKSEKNPNINTIIINNNINTFNYNVNINNFTTCKDEAGKTETHLLKKRNRLNSFEGLFNLFPDLGKEFGMNNNHYYFKKAFDETEYADNFNCTFKNVKNDFEMEKDLDLENMIMLSQSEDSSNSFIQFDDEDILFSDNKLKIENDCGMNDFTLYFDIAKKQLKNFELEMESSINFLEINKPYSVNVETNFLKF